MKTNKITSEQMKLAVNINSGLYPKKHSIFDNYDKDWVDTLTLFCQKIDESIQLAYDAGNLEDSNDFSQTYNEIDIERLTAKSGIKFPESSRNKIRHTMKYWNKQASVYFC